MVIVVRDVSKGADTAAQGQILYSRLHEVLKTGTAIVLSFSGIKTATSSFVNTAFVPLLVEHTLDSLKKRLKIVESTRQINDMIKTRLERENQKLKCK